MLDGFWKEKEGVSQAPADAKAPTSTRENNPSDLHLYWEYWNKQLGAF